MKINCRQTIHSLGIKPHNSSGIKTKSGVFARGVFLSLLAFLLLGLTAETKANVIQANQTYPPPNGSFRVVGTGYHFGSGGTAVVFTNVAFTFFDNFVLVAGPVPTLSFNAQFSHRISMNGGATFSGEQAATAHFVVSLTAPVGNNYTFSITTLTISGADLPATFQLRKPVGALPGSPVVTFTPNTPSPGLFSIVSTFFLPLELSQNSGGSWTPNTVFSIASLELAPLSNEEVTHAPTLPPGDGQYYNPDQYHAAFASGIVVRNPIHNGFIGQSCTDTNSSGQPGLTNVLCPPPLLGGTTTEDFTSQLRFDLDMPATTHIGPINASVQTKVTHTQDSGVLQIFNAQMMQLNPDLGSLPPGMNFRLNPDPNKPSRGMTTMRPGASASDTYICSAFALRLQMTTDNGATWQDADRFSHMNLRILPGTGFPTVAATNNTTFSIGVFEVVVDPNFAFLFAPAPTYFSYYPGYGGTNSGILTSPVMFDSATRIGESVAHVRNSVSPTYFPVAAGSGIANYPAPNSAYSNILSYADYSFVPPEFTIGRNGVDEIMTEIEQLDLQGYVASGQGTHTNSGCPDPRVPSVPMSLVSVKAGPGAFGIGAPLTLNRRSIGMVQQITNGAADDFPAQSFFDIFVDVNLPRVPGTVANTAFPATGAVLYNAPGDPLLIENLSLTNLPPEATYVHGNTTAVPIHFRDNNPPYWAAGDVLGYLTLAGHGVFTNPVTAQLPCAAATATGGLLDQTLGPIGSPNSRPPIPWLRPTNSFPTPGTAYGSMVNRPVDSGVTNFLDDQASFFIPGVGMVSIRDVSLGNLLNPIPPPPYLGTNYYNPPGVAATMELTMDGVNWVPAVANGPASVIISNTTPAGSFTSIFATEMLSLNLTGDSPSGPMMLRESPTKQSLGRHMIGSDPRGYRVSSFFDVFLELSMDDGATWTPANKALRLHTSVPPPIPESVFVTQTTATNLVLQWQNSFTLQSATDLLGPWKDASGVSAPFTNPYSGKQRFFRLRN
jgi:hypothetical protein